MDLVKLKPEMIDQNIKGSVSWKSPSNLAIVKYWGKYGNQLPKNPSLSLTLDNAYTRTTVEYKYKSGNGISLDFRFEGKENQKFEQRITKFLKGILDYFPFLEQLHLSIDSSNSFPHSSGIASSASSMSALVLCLCDMEKELSGGKIDKILFLKKTSFVSRLGSGSACRSVYPHAALWGHHEAVKESSNEYAIPFSNKIDGVFKSFHDDILIVSGEEKSVSSSAGHALMEGNVYAQDRYDQARDRTIQLIRAMGEGDIKTFGRITEDEALTLHALMMCSNPSYMLIEPGSVSIMKAVRTYREDTDLPLYFSLDAGPNIHLLYPDSVKKEASAFIEDKLRPFCHEGRIINDHVGKGPEKL